MELRVTNALEGLQLLQQSWPTVAVSLVGDDLRFPLVSFGPHHLVLRFHDVERPDIVGYLAPTDDHIRAVLQHTKAVGAGDRVLIHCHAGKSRSPAMALGILIQSGMSPIEAFSRVRAVRAQLIPNRLMIRQIDEILDLRGALVELVDDHYRSLGPAAALPDRGGLNL